MTRRSEVVAAATEVIGSNVEDGVVRRFASAWSPDAQMQPVDVGPSSREECIECDERCERSVIGPRWRRTLSRWSTCSWIACVTNPEQARPQHSTCRWPGLLTTTDIDDNVAIPLARTRTKPDGVAH